MIVIDSSAWIEFLRDTGSEVCIAVDVARADERRQRRFHVGAVDDASHPDRMPRNEANAIRTRPSDHRADGRPHGRTWRDVYCWCMSRTNIDLDDAACDAVMERFNLRSKRDAVNLALRRLAAEPLDVDDARRLRGSGWDGDLDERRGSRVG